MASLRAVVLGATLLGVALGFPQFRDKIPNGHSVPSPCDIITWAGVGHMDSAGGGALNPFGVAFRDAGFEWTEALCLADSDGDGRSNGKELGDLDCTWTKGDTAALATGHPGFDESECP